jgi:hypothetical protein
MTFVVCMLLSLQFQFLVIVDKTANGSSVDRRMYRQKMWGLSYNFF